ncbi:MAG: hypothetical protein HQK49_03690 [Oligoflexia bacterium]|nr:hypothetical protein [Oligoflexia bacterium]
MIYRDRQSRIVQNKFNRVEKSFKYLLEDKRVNIPWKIKFKQILKINPTISILKKIKFNTIKKRKDRETINGTINETKNEIKSEVTREVILVPTAQVIDQNVMEVKFFRFGQQQTFAKEYFSNGCKQISYISKKESLMTKKELIKDIIEECKVFGIEKNLRIRQSNNNSIRRNHFFILTFNFEDIDVDIYQKYKHISAVVKRIDQNVKEKKMGLKYTFKTHKNIVNKKHQYILCLRINSLRELI